MALNEQAQSPWKDKQKNYAYNTEVTNITSLGSPVFTATRTNSLGLRDHKSFSKHIDLQALAASAWPGFHQASCAAVSIAARQKQLYKPHALVKDRLSTKKNLHKK